MFKRDIFGHYIFIKRFLISAIGLFTYNRLKVYNSIKIKGTEHLQNLPTSNVLFVSNHQTYFADVIAILHVFCSIKNGHKNSLPNIGYLFNPATNVYFVAAQETMKEGFLPKVFAYAGSVSIKRTWREGGKDINRKVDFKDLTKIENALKSGWLINFPQGTTKAYAPGRKGTVHIIKQQNPIIVPIVINGFRRAFDKKGLRLKKTGVKLSITFKAPLNLDLSRNSDEILNDVMDSIEQSEKFAKPTRIVEKLF